MALDVRILGPVRVERDGATAKLVNQARAVLAVFVLRHGSPVSADQLIDMLWTGSPPRSARTHVQGLVSMLRRTLCTGPGPGAPRTIETEPTGYVLRLKPAELDLHRFRHAITSAEYYRREGRVTEAVRAYASALDLWSGVPCEGVEQPTVRHLTEPLVQVHADALENWAELALDTGESACIAAHLHQVVRQHPFRERLRALLMTALHHAGRTGEALILYEEGRRLLADELGIDPSPSLQGLHERLLRGGTP